MGGSLSRAFTAPRGSFHYTSCLFFARRCLTETDKQCQISHKVFTAKKSIFCLMSASKKPLFFPELDKIK
ncbi:MAG: hypothetical protein AMJ60_04950 [Desulfobacterales bacterium SG8_35]|nr:MAG: hypothetical protein AMJ60_04950 [Desulfobacterales bacterium SG8_35]